MLGNAAFAGSAAFFGHGSPDPHGTKSRQAAATGESGHGDHTPPARPATQPGVKERFDLELDITATLNEQSRKKNEVLLKLVAVDAAGNEVPAGKLILEETVIEVE